MKNKLPSILFFRRTSLFMIFFFFIVIIGYGQVSIWQLSDHTDSTSHIDNHMLDNVKNYTNLLYSANSNDSVFFFEARRYVSQREFPLKNSRATCDWYIFNKKKFIVVENK